MEWSPRVLLSAAPKNVEQRLKEYVGGKPLQNLEAETSSLLQNLKLMCLEELSPIYTVPSMVWKLCQGGPGRGVNLVKIKKERIGSIFGRGLVI